MKLNFHPDRIVGGMLILEAMGRDGCYRSQFETGTSNGGLTAHPGGDRWSWESRLFGRAYDTAPASERPKYGSLNFRSKPAGGSPRFGSAHIRLNAATLTRTTFCYPDSVFEPTHLGVASRMSLIARAEADEQDGLDDYIEAQVHGPLLVPDDVEASSSIPASAARTSSGQPAAWVAPSNGTPDSGSASTNCNGILTTAGRST